MREEVGNTIPPCIYFTFHCVSILYSLQSVMLNDITIRSDDFPSFWKRWLVNYHYSIKKKCFPSVAASSKKDVALIYSLCMQAN